MKASCATSWRHRRRRRTARRSNKRSAITTWPAWTRKAIEAKGIAPLKPELDRIAAIKDKAALADVLARQHALGASPLFNLYARADYKNSNLMIAWLDQGGLGLPDRDYYFRTDAKSAEIRAKYVDAYARMFVLARATRLEGSRGGEDYHEYRDGARENIAGSCRAPECEQSESSRYGEGPEGSHSCPSTGTATSKIGNTAASTTSTLRTRSSSRILNQVLTATPLDDLKTYLTWHMLARQRRDAPDGVRERKLRFLQPVSIGTEGTASTLETLHHRRRSAISAKRWDRSMWNLRSPENSKDQDAADGQRPRKGDGEDIRQIDWMTPETKKRALEKLHAIAEKIGYPENWRDYSS